MTACLRVSKSEAPEVSLVLLDKGQVLVDVVRGADHKGHPLVEALRLDVQHPVSAGGGEAPRLLDDEGDGVALVQQPQLGGEFKESHVSITYFSCRQQSGTTGCEGSPFPWGSSHWRGT